MSQEGSFSARSSSGCWTGLCRIRINHLELPMMSAGIKIE